MFIRPFIRIIRLINMELCLKLRNKAKREATKMLSCKMYYDRNLYNQELKETTEKILLRWVQKYLIKEHKQSSYQKYDNFNKEFRRKNTHLPPIMNKYNNELKKDICQQQQLIDYQDQRIQTLLNIIKKN